MERKLIILLLFFIQFPLCSQELESLPEVRIASSVKDLLVSTRKIYTMEVTNKLFKDGTGSIKEYKHQRGFAPLPAQLIKGIGQDMIHESKDEVIIQLKSKYFVSEEGRLVDDNEKAAWDFLLQQQNTATNVEGMNWEPYLYISNKQGVDYLTYISSDIATTKQCVSCHEIQELNASVQYARKQHGITDKPTLKRWHMIGIFKIEVKLK